MKRLDSMVDHGTLVAEAKSGYGLDLETEVKMLKVIQRAKNNHKMKIQSTYLCAHAVPLGKNAEEMTEGIRCYSLVRIYLSEYI
jgi:imidazolonepropionase